MKTRLVIRNRRAKVGMKVKDTRGNKAVLISWSEPHPRSLLGRVVVEHPGGVQREYYPNVFHGEFVEVRRD